MITDGHLHNPTELSIGLYRLIYALITTEGRPLTSGNLQTDAIHAGVDLLLSLSPALAPDARMTGVELMTGAEDKC